MKRRPRVFFLGMITTDAYGRAIGEQTFAGAAARKMTLIVYAMRRVGLKAAVVSLPFVGASADRFRIKQVSISDGGVPIIFTATLRSSILRKLVGPFHLLCTFQRLAERGDTLICYNHAIEYLPALLACRLRGIKLIQDIEDAPNIEERGLRGAINRFAFGVTSRLTAARKMVVADHVAKTLELDDFVTIRGVAGHEGGAPVSQDTAKWQSLRAGGPLKLHFGGTLLTETGIDLFCETIEYLLFDEDQLCRDISFKVTGVGELEKISALQDRIGSSGRVTIELFPELNKAEYLGLIDSCHGSLSLKRPGSAMSDTTFPSKVIEITSAGLALVTAQLGDVADIFGLDTAFFFREYTPKHLGEVVKKMSADPTLVERVAAAGQDLCWQVFSPEAVGAKMKLLL